MTVKAEVHGGVLVYVPKRCRSKSRLDLEDDEIECVWVELRLNKRTILMGNMYRPPNAHSSLITGQLRGYDGDSGS